MGKGQKPLEGRRLSERFPLLAEQYSEVLNEVPLSEVPYSFPGEAWWTCREAGHSWRGKVYNRTLTSRVFCPVCEGTLIQPGVNDFLTLGSPRLLRELSQRNSPALLETLHPRSKKVLWWECAQGHQWEESLYNRARPAASGCPCCSGKRLPLEKSLAAVEPLRKELAPPFLPEGASLLSRKILPWLCPLRHPWEASPFARSRGASCPFCAQKKVLSGFNDLETLFPEVAQEWAAENPLSPSEVLATGSRRALWTCRTCSHGWGTSVRNRTVRGASCPKCKPAHRSALEDEVEALLRELTGEPLEVRTRKVLPGGQELDFYFPSLSLGVEVNGDYWHGEERSQALGYASSEERHRKKLTLSEGEGVTLAYLWEGTWKKARPAAEEALREFLASGEVPPLLQALSPPLRSC